MCVVSFVGDEWRKRSWPEPGRKDPTELYPDIWKKIEKLIPTAPVQNATIEDIKNFIAAIELARKYDVENDEEYCADSKKLCFIDELEQKLRNMISDDAYITSTSSDHLQHLRDVADALIALQKIKTYI